MPISQRFRNLASQTWLTRLRTWLARLREHFPLTTQGLVTLTLVMLALQVFGFGRMDLVVFALGVCALAILGFVLLSVIGGGLLLQFRVGARLRESGSDVASTVEAGYPNETGFSLPAYNLLPLIRLSWEVVYPDAIETRTPVSSDGDRLLEEILPHRRFRTTRLVRRFTVSDVLGFCRYSWRQGQAVNLQALPRSNTINTLPLLRSLTAEDGIPSPSGNPEGDRMEIRPYVPGDSVRNIMWKVYARTGELNVRLPERSVFHSTRTVAYLVSGGNDEAAAAVARVAIESGALGDNWVFSADGTETPCTDRQTALQAIAASRALHQGLAYGLDRFLATVAEQSGCHCIVFAAAEDGAWVKALKQTLSRFRGRFSVVLATDGFADDKPVPRWKHLVWMNFESGPTARQHGQAPRTPRAGLIPLLTELGQLVESTLVVDRHTGSSFDGRLRRV